MSDLLKLLDERDADGEKAEGRQAQYAIADPVRVSEQTWKAGVTFAPQVTRSYWSPTPDPALYDNSSKTAQARGPGYLEVLSTTVIDGADLYGTVLGAGLKTRTY